MTFAYLSPSRSLWFKGEGHKKEELRVTRAQFDQGKSQTNYCFNYIDSSPPRQNGCHFADDSFQCLFMNEKFFISI